MGGLKTSERCLRFEAFLRYSKDVRRKLIESLLGVFTASKRYTRSREMLLLSVSGTESLKSRCLLDFCVVQGESDEFERPEVFALCGIFA